MNDSSFFVASLIDANAGIVNPRCQTISGVEKQDHNQDRRENREAGEGVEEKPEAQHVMRAVPVPAMVSMAAAMTH